jgi:hypothetical protein
VTNIYDEIAANVAKEIDLLKGIIPPIVRYLYINISLINLI